MLRRCYWSSVVSILGQFYVAGRRWNVVHIQTEEYLSGYKHEGTGKGGSLKGSHKGAGV